MSLFVEMGETKLGVSAGIERVEMDRTARELDGSIEGAVRFG